VLGKSRQVSGDRRINQRKPIFILEERDSAGLEVPARNLCLTGLPEHRSRENASRKRDEGVINQVEFIDARSSLTGAELNLNVTRFDVLSRQAQLDYATASGTLPLEALTARAP